MKSKIQILSVILVSVLVGVLGSYLVFRGEDIELAAAPGMRVVKTNTQGKVKKVTEITLSKQGGEHVVKIVQSEQPRPFSEAASAGTAQAESSDDNVEEDQLNAAQKAVLKELQDALDNNNLKQVRKALSKFVASSGRGGSGGKVPVCMRSRAVEALGWFGKDAAVDLIEYVADSNEDVSNDAFTQFEQAISDCEMGDVERAQLLTAMLKALNDGDQVDSLLSQLNDMRNSVKAQAASEILTTGSDVAKAKLQEQLEFYFEEGVVNADGVAKWKVVNPDEASDAETYGGAKSSENGASK